MNIGIIPARMASSRFPGKPLKKILGISMIRHCYFRTRLCKNLKEVYVATCDEDIYEEINSIGGKAIMTSNKHTRASTRASEACQIIQKKHKLKIENIIMVQGDEPFILPEDLDKVINTFDDSTVQISNLMGHIKFKNIFLNKNNVKVVFDKKNNALYFSREPIPSLWQNKKHKEKFIQSGIIGFRFETLIKFNKLNETNLEILESVDMNRALENGIKVRMVPTNNIVFGVDTREDLIEANNIMKKDILINQYKK